MQNVRALSIFMALVLLLVASHSAVAQGPLPPVPLQIDGQTVLLEPGKNVHMQTYALLLRDPAFASRADVKWVFVDDMWVPLARAGLEKESSGEELRSSGPGYTPEGIPECWVTLSVPAYRQGSPPWGTARLFDDPACSTMAQEGCAITSAAMVFRYHGANTDPGVLNTCAGSNGCRSGCGLAWGCAANNCSGSRAAYGGYYGFYWEALCGLLAGGTPPIVRVGGPHFVVVYKSVGGGSDPGKYYINDPLDGSTYKKLAYYGTPTMVAEYPRR